MSRTRWRGATALAIAASAMAVTACGGDDEGGGGGDGSAPGVTSEPCPGSDNPDRGCIYLGILSDLTVGPFAALAVPITEAQEDFWDRVNANGGIDGRYDVNVEEFTRDNEYNPEVHVQAYREIEPEVLALAQTLGTPPTLAAIDLYDQDDVISNTGTWWSGWSFKDADNGTILESGQPYCIESQNGLDYMVEEFGEAQTVMAVHFPGDYGGDSAAGVEEWGQANDVEVVDVETAPNQEAGNQDAVVSAIRRENPDYVVIATSPTEMAEIVGGSVAGGFEGRFVGSVPTYNQAVLESEAADAINQRYIYTSPHEPFGSDTPAHRAMEQALGGELPENDGYTIGWVWSYPLLAVLEEAGQSGDLTREGVRAAVEQVTVDFEGALADHSYSGDANEIVNRESVIVQPDEQAPLGSSTVEEGYTGPTAEEFDFTEPCAAGA